MNARTVVRLTRQLHSLVYALAVAGDRLSLDLYLLIYMKIRSGDIPGKIS